MLAVTGLALGAVAFVPSPGETATAATVALDWNHRPVGQAPCPEGKARSSTVVSHPLESSIPWKRFDNGWSRVSGSPPSGSTFARSTLSGSTSDPKDFFFLNPVTVTAGRDTRLAFATRGTFPSGKGLVSVNSVAAHLTGSSGWTGRVVNLTTATDDEGGRLYPWFEHRRTAGTSTRWDLDNLQIYTCRAAATTRIAGSSRYATAARVSSRFPTGQDTVFVARGDAFADALAGSALAGSLSAPVLLVKSDAVPDVVRTALTRLDPDRIVILGGTAAVSSAVEQTLADYARSSVERWAGSTRYETAALVSATYPASTDLVYLATGEDYPDALSGAAVAARDDAPILLTKSTSLPAAVSDELARMSPSHVVILGGTAAVSSGVADAVRSSGATVTRLSGSNRYATSAAISATFPASVTHSYLATGTGFADALSGGALAGRDGAPLLLARPTSIPGVVTSELKRLSENHGYVLGGQGALASIVRDRYGRTLP